MGGGKSATGLTWTSMGSVQEEPLRQDCGVASALVFSKRSCFGNETIAQVAAAKWIWRVKTMTIDRAIEILDPEHREHYESIDPVNEACRMGMEALERTRWIPCSERLPEKAGFYLVATPRGIEIMEFSSGDKRYRETPCFVSEVLGKVSGYVTHWMPLPELPKE